MTNPNPLQKFFRQPKVYISLPSKGIYYPSGALDGDYSNVPVFAMTGMDEIIYKTPDALFSGEATAKVIESCVPYIKNARAMPSTDIDAVIIAIRIATTGNSLTINHTCDNCSAENSYDVDLSTFLDYFNNLKFINVISISDELTLKIRPLSYEEMNRFSVENFKLQKILVQTSSLDEEEKQKQFDLIYQELSKLQLEIFVKSIESVQLQTAVVSEKEFIEEWLKNADRSIYEKIKQKLEENKAQWNIPAQKVKCDKCNTDASLAVVLDQSNFFA